jgi:hypothetical protein
MAHGTPLAHGTAERTLTDADVAAIAAAVAERLAPTRPLVDARAIAELLGVTAATVRDHAVELGGRRVGDGVRPRWRFDVATALERASALSSSKRPQAPDRPQPSRRRVARRSSTVELLPVRSPNGGRDGG